MVKSTTLSKSPASFEDALKELESIVQSMEGSELALEASLAAYRRGTELLKFCQDRLTTAEQQVRVLDGERLSNLPTDAAD
ncbi:MAG: exodeoxyribonuclease VII small subunit [Rhodocyclaceae bacterium]|nr:exodeoxyribonuclease VII small subunit [Rhodocyclaceae bacterium]